MTPTITLYTNPYCPWAQRAHIALKELKLGYEEVFIDVEKPREEWYLAINPKGQVPTLSYNGTTIAESGIIAQFLADVHSYRSPNPDGGCLLLPSTSHIGALQRARITAFVDAWVSKVYPVLTGVILNGEDHDSSTEALVGVLEREIEPLLLVSFSTKDGDGDGDVKRGEFFGGSERLTLAEVLVGPFLLWLFTLCKEEYGVLRSDLVETLQGKTPRFAKWGLSAVTHESVACVFDEIGRRLKGRWEEAVAKKN
ncbi:thioredoxin-like protein [Aspergillus karnatakaensis]|uniref:glutathione S-transferase family protein n=1 Tax=Aspergillus karnatakaensis TaxID=1810916 RepID=UPI003CCE2E7D